MTEDGAPRQAGRWLAKYHADTKAILASDLHPFERLILLAYRVHTNGKTGKAWPGVAAIKAHTGLSERTIRTYRQRLVTAGLLVADDAPAGKVTPYRVGIPDPCTACTPAPGAPLHDVPVTPAPGAPPPLHDVHPTPAPRAPEQERENRADQNRDEEQTPLRPPRGGSPPMPVAKVWGEVTALRLELLPGARMLDLTPLRRRQLNARLTENGKSCLDPGCGRVVVSTKGTRRCDACAIEKVLLVMRWVLASDDYRARQLQAGGFEVDTALRPSKFDKYLAAATGPRIDADPFSKRIREDAPILF